ncbi:hypothetical protein EVAR_66954_1 [Eumeta japonica]|uniref:Uncharacterized protein n=1 Tax=Eumeta variegata TaxID=151549 RepID=A0A4C1ZTE9_EUMVA|nr:hypothetical protein EVAR_66954_1 [Eumeta japonica]
MMLLSLALEGGVRACCAPASPLCDCDALARRRYGPSPQYCQRDQVNQIYETYTLSSLALGTKYLHSRFWNVLSIQLRVVF